MCVSTACCLTAGGRRAVGKYHKIRADAFYLLNAAGVLRRILVFTDRAMKEHFENEQARGRFPKAPSIELEAIS